MYSENRYKGLLYGTDGQWHLMALFAHVSDALNFAWWHSFNCPASREDVIIIDSDLNKGYFYPESVNGIDRQEAFRIAV